MSIADDLHGERATVTGLDTPDLTILYGSQTGNAEYLANEIYEAAQKGASSVALASLEEWMHSDDRSLRRLLIVTSTHDNGHMPDNAAEFWDWVQNLEPGALSGMPYAVLSIGDSMYDDFCKAGHDIDGRLEQLGAVRIVDGVDCDIDFEFTATKWAKPAVSDLLAAEGWDADPAVAAEAGLEPGSASASDAAVAVAVAAASSAAAAERLHRARIAASRQLSTPGSAKQVMHYEIAVEDGGFDYEPGDSISVFIENSEELVAAWLDAFGGEDPAAGDASPGLRDVLRTQVELRLPHPGLVVSLGRLRPNNQAVRLIGEMIQAGDREALDAWLWGRDVLDVLRDLDCLDVPVRDVLDILKPLQHRDYSIASSPVSDDGAVHLTVNGVRYDANARAHRGAATEFLRARADDGQPFEVRRIAAHEFRLPAPETPVIMIGPGVGVAPFRAFLRHRDAVGAGGANWLFFGDQHRDHDFLYEGELRDLTRRDVLTHLSLAFSRDQAQKHYVQDEIRAAADELRRWVADGAFIFVCGDKSRMASDVDAALTEVLSAGDGAPGLDWLKSQGRYVKDVY